SLRRAVELGEGWAPFNVTPDEVKDWIAAATTTDAWQRREGPLEVVIGSDQLFDPVGRPDAAAARARELHDAGATTLSLRFVHDSVDHYVEQLEAMTEVAENL